MILYYLIALGVLSLITFILFGVDKAKSKGQGGRIPEITLLSFAALGGSLGALLGRVLFRHKTNGKNKFHFAAVTFGSLLIHAVAGLLLLLYV